MFRKQRKLDVAILCMLVFGVALLLANLTGQYLPEQPPQSPEERAIAYLGVEVPRWHKENHCYSCHNNGDGARALMQARRDGYTLLSETLEDTRKWLEQPLNWDHNGGEGGFSDKVLARIQFARALADLTPLSKPAAAEAARTLAQDQQPDGYWRIEDGGAGSPCTYGNALATAQACQALKLLAPREERTAIQKAEGWLALQPRKCLLDHVGVLFGLDKGIATVRHSACDALLAAQERDGGWGLFPTSGSEPFDTAVALLALTSQPDGTRYRQAIERGRLYLLATQQPDGGWIETTRPPGAVSYAQRISTTGWATLALLATRNRHVTR
jgi:Prenyltransferase and squalene oxidase repeat